MIFALNFHEFLNTMYKYALNSVVKISLMFAQYFEYYAIILRGGGVFSWTLYITAGYILSFVICNLVQSDAVYTIQPVVKQTG